MRPKTALTKISPLLRAPSFTSAEARTRGVTAATLAHYVSVGDLSRVGRGVYKGSNAPAVEDFRWEDLVETVKRAKDAAICLVSALAFYELTEEKPRQHWIAIRHDTGHHHPPSTKVVRMRNFDLGKTTAKIGAVTFPIFYRERTIVDSFRFLSRETAIKALKAALKKKGSEKINLERLQEYAKKLRVDIEPYLLAVTT
jgi:predicted transcriptional regulator of viral defense system